MPASPITIVVAEDNAIFARGLADLLGAIPEVTLLEMATDRDTAVAAIRRHSPDVVITDLRMPPTSTDEGLQVARRAHSHRARTGVIVFTQFAEVDVVARLLDDGASGRGYLLKDHVADPAELLDAIRRVAAGGTVVDPSLARELMNRERTGDDPIAHLTPTERDVLRLIAQGYGNDGIADRLSVSRSAVEKHVTTVFRKLPIEGGPGSNRRVQSVLFYLANCTPEPVG